MDSSPVPVVGFSAALRSNALVEWFYNNDGGNLSPSYPEPLRMAEVLGMASDELLRDWEGMQLGYAGGRGGAELRAAVAQLYETVEADDVLSCVPDEGIFLALMALLEPGAEVIVTCPAYASLYEIAHAQGCTVRHWLPAVAAEGEAGREAGELYFSPEELRGLITPRTGLVVVNFPHNPTGALPTRPEHEAIVECCREHKLMMFSDEMYRLLEYSPEDRLPAACDSYELGISLAGMSKAYAMPGIRVGWLCTRNTEILDRMAKLKEYTTICGGTPNELLARIGLENGTEIIARNLGTYTRARNPHHSLISADASESLLVAAAILSSNLERVCDFFDRHPDRFEFVKPRVGTVVFPKLKLASDDAVEYCSALATEHGLVLVPPSAMAPPDVVAQLTERVGPRFRLGFGRTTLEPLLLELDGAVAAEAEAVAAVVEARL